MIEYPSSVVMTARSQEIVQNRERDFPYTAMHADLQQYAGGGTPWHWHDHFEVAMVDRGRMELCTRQGSLMLEAGEGYFLNANVLHQCRMADSNVDACMHTQLFGRELISGSGLIARRYVSTVENCVELEVLRLDPRVEAHARILESLRSAFDEAAGDASGYEMFVCAHLCAAWGGIYRLAQSEIERSQGQPREDVLRAKAMLSFIYENYMRPLTVKQIAQAAGICERECFRCFAEILDTTPMLCLNRHRVGMACRALSESDASVGEIAEACGFASAGYFGKVFRRVTGLTPVEFRRKGA